MKQLLARQRNQINNAICGIAKGVFNDDFWYGMKQVTLALDELRSHGFEWNIEGSRYDHEDGKPVRKTWAFRVSDGQREGFGVIVAAGCGTNDDPLGFYDVVAYMA